MYFIYASEPFGWLERFTVFSLKLHPHVHGMNTRADRSHVWHMKVLHYTVFKDQEVATASDRSIVIIPKITPKRNRRTRIEARGRSLKAEQCSRYHTPSYTRSLSDGDLAIAVRHEVQLRADFLSPTLAITGRRTPGDSASSVVDSSMYATALPATGEPVACTP